MMLEMPDKYVKKDLDSTSELSLPVGASGHPGPLAWSETTKTKSPNNLHWNDDLCCSFPELHIWRFIVAPVIMQGH